MREILSHLRAGAMVLDLGCDQGSFDEADYPRLVCIRADLEKPRTRLGRFVQADAGRLPFRSGWFDAVICNHSLEHFPALDSALTEIGRLLKPDGAFFASVPDSSSLTDRLYRWLGKGGGHVNAIRDVRAFVRQIESKTGLRHRGTRVLLTSLAFLNPRSPTARPMRAVVDLGIDPEPLLALATWLFRKLDQALGTRLSISGWLLYFGGVGEKVSERLWSNMCVRCGAAHPSEYLLASRLVRGWGFFRHYGCPCCGATNLFTRDDRMQDIC